MTADPAEVIQALAAAAALGPFFALDTDPPPSTTPAGAPGWRAFAELTDDPAVTRARINAIRRGIAERGRIPLVEVPPRAAASLAHLGLVSRLFSPSFGAALLGGVVPDLRSLHWREVLGPVPLTLPDPRGSVVDATDVEAVAAALTAQLTDGPVARLGDAIAAVGAVSARVLRGNVASAVAGSAGMVASASPAHARAALAVAQRLLEQAPLVGTGAFTETGFRRTTCCLYYQVPGGGYCGDCVLLGRSDVRTR